MMKRIIFDWNYCPNISLLDDKVIWWNEEEICIEMKQKGEL